MVSFVNDHGIYLEIKSLHKYQGDSRDGFSCLSAAQQIVLDCLNSKMKKAKFSVMLMSFCKAYDCENLNISFTKLEIAGISDTAPVPLDSFLNDQS